MTEPPRPEPPPHQRAAGLRGAVVLLGGLLAANLLDLVCRYPEASATPTPRQTILLIVQAAVSGILLLLLAIAILALTNRPRKEPVPARRPHLYDLDRPLPVERN